MKRKKYISPSITVVSAYGECGSTLGNYSIQDEEGKTDSTGEIIEGNPPEAKGNGLWSVWDED